MLLYEQERGMEWQGSVTTQQTSTLINNHCRSAARRSVIEVDECGHEPNYNIIRHDAALEIEVGMISRVLLPAR